MRGLALLGVALAAVPGWYLYAHRAGSPVVIHAADLADLEVDGRHYHGAWSGDVKTFGGAVHWTGPVNDKAAPFLTHEVLLTTGDYSDPARVSIQPVAHHHTTWHFMNAPKGTIFVVHCIPSTEEIRDALDGLAVGQDVELEGEVLDGLLVGPPDSAGAGRATTWGATSPSHPTVYVRAVRHVGAADAVP